MDEVVHGVAFLECRCERAGIEHVAGEEPHAA
jgi:hypothetical protein